MYTLGRWYTSTGTAVESVCVCKLIVEQQQHQREEKTVTDWKNRNWNRKITSVQRGKIGSIRFGVYNLCLCFSFCACVCVNSALAVFFVFAHRPHLIFILSSVHFFCPLLFINLFSLYFSAAIVQFSFFAPSSSSSSLNIEYHSKAVKWNAWWLFHFTSLSIVTHTHTHGHTCESYL